MTNRRIKKLPIKKNLSSTQVLKTLRALLDGSYSMSELTEKLNKNEPEAVFNNSVISKYINTCKYCGIKIAKINNKYYVSSLPFGLSISNSESELIKNFQTISKDILTINACKHFNRVFDTICQYSNRVIERVQDDNMDNVRCLFEQAVYDERKVRLMLKNNIIMECVPIDVYENNGKIYFHVSHNEKEQNVIISKVVGVEILTERFCKTKEDNAVIYKLMGKLAQNYTLRENEKIITNGLPEEITIVNYNGNTPALLSRLLKYGELCELKFPKYIKEELKNIIDEALENYGV